MILVVNRNARNAEILKDFLEKHGYPTCPALDLEDFDRALSRDDLRLALVDLTGFPEEIWERCRALQRKGIPFLLISPGEIRGLEARGAQVGARGLLKKPLSPRYLLEFIKGLLEEEE